MRDDGLFDGFNLDELLKLRLEVEELRDAAILTTGSVDVEIEAADRIAGYNKVLAELNRRIAAKGTGAA